MKPITAVSKTTKLHKEVSRLKGPLTWGTVLVIDPSIGSTSSLPGYALYREGNLTDSGTIFTGGSHLELWQRARRLGDALRTLCDGVDIDVLIYEDIPATSGFNQNAVASLLKATGIVLACTSSAHVLGIHPASWKNYVRPEYKKGDREDAIEIGYIAIALARHILAGVSDSDGDSLPHRNKRHR